MGVRIQWDSGCRMVATLCTLHSAVLGDQARRTRSQMPRLATSSSGGAVPSRMARATIAAEAGPVLMPQGPCPAHTKRPSTPWTSPMNGRPSTDCGRAHRRCPISSAPSIDRQELRGSPQQEGRNPAGVGFRGQERRSERADTTGAGDAEQRGWLPLLSASARAVAAAARLIVSTSSSSTMWRGADPSSRSWSVTPQVAADRCPGAGWIDQRGRPGSRRHQDGIGDEARAVVETDAHDARALDHRPGRGADRSNAPRSSARRAQASVADAGGIG